MQTTWLENYHGSLAKISNLTALPADEETRRIQKSMPGSALLIRADVGQRPGVTISTMER
jgi:hypothetical protein